MENDMLVWTSVVWFQFLAGSGSQAGSWLPRQQVLNCEKGFQNQNQPQNQNQNQNRPPARTQFISCGCDDKVYSSANGCYPSWVFESHILELQTKGMRSAALPVYAES